MELLRSTGGASIIRDYVRPKRALRAKSGATVRFETEPRLQLQTDWGVQRTLIAGQPAEVHFAVSRTRTSVKQGTSSFGVFWTTNVGLDSHSSKYRQTASWAENPWAGSATGSPSASRRTRVKHVPRPGRSRSAAQESFGKTPVKNILKQARERRKKEGSRKTMPR